ncbi:hypothetical protein [Candidatus Uabimicrobium sp. HlEnr_7]|uniref:hypothetical protein n=1 Tax=Candidatus Uabimicrobium helgolandensis TaxID=3095367 RepID=UPI0035590575
MYYTRLCLICQVFFLLMCSSFVLTEEDRLQQLEKKLELLSEEVTKLRALREQDQIEIEKLSNKSQKFDDKLKQTIQQEVSEFISETPDQTTTYFDTSSWLQNTFFGGYVDLNANFEEGTDGDFSDIHRVVLFLGYNFNTWISMYTEIEIEHAFVSDDSGGEVVIEQLMVDFSLSQFLNFRIGRILTPVGYLNARHNPTTFHGVERPAFATFILPSTWSSDGIGIFGNITQSLSYEAYIVGGLDGSLFDDVKGIRDGRIKERPSYNEPAFTSRIQFSPSISSEVPQVLITGVSMYAGGLDNGNKGENPDIDANIQIYALDFLYSLGRLEFRGEFAYEKINGANEIGNNVAKEILGGYLQMALRVTPDALKVGKLRNSDLYLFTRYDYLDTQFNVPSGVDKNPAGKRDEWTFGLTFFFEVNLALKFDIQLRNDDDKGDLTTLYNLGLVWIF